MNLPLLKNTLFLSTALFLLLSCQHSRQLEAALDAAGENRAELEKVLEHYQNDKQKYQAACFLIENMPGHGGVDSASIAQLQNTYDKHVAISEKYGWEYSDEFLKEITALWEKARYNYPLFQLNKDIKTIRAEWLINEIDRSFQAWKENAYTQNLPFEDFCHYILPYRYAEGACLDNSRNLFYQRHAHLFTDKEKDFRQEIDTLHKKSDFIKHSKWTTPTIPIYNAKTLEYVRRGICNDKAWYNCLQLSALGMAVAIDFVPAWGNRSGGHSWNCVIIEGRTYPFEPFWESKRWKYKRIYNNECFDVSWGTFRLPKVYRHTFEPYIQGPMADLDVQRSDIPALFLNPFIKDVSDEYFKTTDVEIRITENTPEDTDYCYLCVYGTNDWKPVQWGKIKNGKVIFKGMGRDIIYCPMFCKNGMLSPAAPAFLLDAEGKQRLLSCRKETMPVSIQTYTSYLEPGEIIDTKKTLTGACLTGSNQKDFASSDTLVYLTDTIDVWGNDICLPSCKRYQYLRWNTPNDSLDLCEIAFFESQNKKPIRILRQTTNMESLSAEETCNSLTDGLSATGWQGKADKNGFVCWDFGKPYEISSIHYIPYRRPHFKKKQDISLCYWSNGWKVAETQQWKKGVLTFTNVPQGTVYLVKGRDMNGRIFLYKDGEVKWY